MKYKHENVHSKFYDLINRVDNTLALQFVLNSD